MLGAVRAELAAVGLDVPLPEQSTISHRLSLLPAALAKGLEFDAVVVVEPARIAAAGTRGVRLLYVAMTRAVQHVVLLHSLGLPAELAAGEGIMESCAP